MNYLCFTVTATADMHRVTFLVLHVNNLPYILWSYCIIYTVVLLHVCSCTYIVKTGNVVRIICSRKNIIVVVNAAKASIRILNPLGNVPPAEIVFRADSRVCYKRVKAWNNYSANSECMYLVEYEEVHSEAYSYNSDTLFLAEHWEQAQQEHHHQPYPSCGTHGGNW